MIRVGEAMQKSELLCVAGGTVHGVITWRTVAVLHKLELS